MEIRTMPGFGLLYKWSWKISPILGNFIMVDVNPYTRCEFFIHIRACFDDELHSTDGFFICYDTRNISHLTLSFWRTRVPPCFFFLSTF